MIPYVPPPREPSEQERVQIKQEKERQARSRQDAWERRCKQYEMTGIKAYEAGTQLTQFALALLNMCGAKAQIGRVPWRIEDMLLDATRHLRLASEAAKGAGEYRRPGGMNTFEGERDTLRHINKAGKKLAKCMRKSWMMKPKNRKTACDINGLIHQLWDLECRIRDRSPVVNGVELVTSWHWLTGKRRIERRIVKVKP